MRTLRLVISVALFTAVPSVLVSGCGVRPGTVTGSVAIDGQPVDSGVISFVSADQAGSPASAKIEGGRYELQVLPGKKFVQISAPVVVGKRKEYEGPDAPLVEITDERLPARYNSKTELTFEVKPGLNNKDWDLKSERAQR